MKLLFSRPLIAALLTVTGFPGASYGQQAPTPPSGVMRADPANCSVTTYGLEHGLPTLSLGTIAVGGDGLLWVSTINGVFVFDGRRFRPLSLPDAKAGEPPRAAAPQNVIKLLRGQDGVMWGSEEGGRIWRIENGVLKAVPADKALRWGGMLFEASDASIWAGGRGLVRIVGSTVETVLDTRDAPARLVTSLLDDPPLEGQLGRRGVEVGTNDSLFHWTREEGLRQVDSVPTIALFRDDSGRRWRVSATGTTISGWDGVIPSAEVSVRLISSTAIDGDRTLIVLDADAYIADFRAGDPHLVPYGESYTVADLLPGPGDSIWVTTLNRGLRLLRPRYFDRIEMPASGRTAYVVKPGRSNEVILGSWLHPRLWRWRSSAPANSSNVELMLEWESVDGQLQFPGVFDAICDDGRSGFVQTNQGLLSFADDSTAPVPGGPYYGGQMVQTDSGVVWARASENVVEVVDGHRTGRSFELGGRQVTEIVADGEDLICFQAGRVIALDTQSMTQRVVLEFVEGTLGTLSLEPSGVLWVLTDGEGLYRRTTAETWDHWTTDHGLPTDSLGWAGTVPGPTEATHLWINSNAGVLAVSLESLDATARGHQAFLDCAVLGTPESLAADGVACDNGILVVPTFEGPIAVDTHRPLPVMANLTLSPGDVLVDGSPLEPGKSLYGSTDVVFEYKAAQFPFQYGSKVQYRLDGHDSEWHEGNDDRTIRYTSLPTGRYQLQLRSRAPGTGFGVPISGPVLRILPRWFERTSVRLGFLALLAAFGVGAFRLRTRLLVDRGRVLELLLDRARVSEDRYRRLFQTTPTPIVMCSSGGSILEANEAASRLFGFHEVEWSTLPEMADGAGDEATLRAAMRRALAGEGPDAVRLGTRVAGGDTHVCGWYLVPLMREDQSVWGIMALVVDHEDEIQAAASVRRLRRQLARAEEAERSKLARELHDDFSQRLAAVSLGLRLSNNDIDGQVDEEQREALEESIVEIERLARDVHKLSRQLHPAVLDDLGLNAALRSECLRRSGLTAARIDFEDDGRPRHLSGEARLAMFRVAQEAMQNAGKHSGAARILVRVSEGVDGLVLVVQDNGKGFEPAAEVHSGIGLSSMRERMSLVEGVLEIESTVGSGTTVRAVAPLSGDASGKAADPQSGPPVHS